ncbi:MFS transporter [Burkholderia multivorans]|uniref:MFS transporter n=1 Tax=Burkholderia multivorans TaxID=87883 RepID=UPI000DABD9EC|nr:MFS transporter [Burkholderia multivorans]
MTQIRTPAWRPVRLGRSIVIDRLRTSRVFYGWYVVAAAFAVTFVGFGSAYTFSAFVEPLQRDFAASRGQISLVFSLAGFLYFGFGIVSGPLADRFGSRRLAVVGMLLTAAGLAAAGIGVGTLVMPPLASALIAQVGWRGAYFALAVLAVVLGAGMSLLIENDPRGRGLLPDGDVTDPATDGASALACDRGPCAGPAPSDAAPRRSSTDVPAAGATVREAVMSRPFASLYAACLVCSFGVFVPFVHLVPYAVDHGVAPAAAVLLLGAIGVGSTAGRFFLGGLADRFGRRASLLAMFAGMAVALVAWAGAGTVATLAAFALVFGVFYGGWVAVLPAVVMDAFGGRNVSAIIGVLYTSVAFGTLIGPAAAGFIYDAGGGYLVPILASAAANAIAFAIVATSGRMRAAARAAGR